MEVMRLWPDEPVEYIFTEMKGMEAMLQMTDVKAECGWHVSRVLDLRKREGCVFIFMETLYYTNRRDGHEDSREQ